MINATLNIHKNHLSGWRSWLWAFSRSSVQISIPASWEEIPAKRRFKVLAALMQAGQVSPEALRLLVFRAMVAVPRRVFFQIRHIDWAEKLLPYIDWALVAQISHPFESTIKIGATVWMLPVPEVKDITVASYFDIEKQWSQLASGKDESLYAFLAALLRPATESVLAHYELHGYLPNNNQLQSEKHAELLRKTSPVQAFYLVQYYSAQRVMIKAKYPNLFSGGKSDGTPMDWESLPARIAEAGVFGPLHQVLITPATAYLAWSNGKAKQAEQEENKSLQDIIRSQHKKFLA